MMFRTQNSPTRPAPVSALSQWPGNARLHQAAVTPLRTGSLQHAGSCMLGHLQNFSALMPSVRWPEGHLGMCDHIAELRFDSDPSGEMQLRHQPSTKTKQEASLAAPQKRHVTCLPSARGLLTSIQADTICMLFQGQEWLCNSRTTLRGLSDSRFLGDMGPMIVIIQRGKQGAIMAVSAAVLRHDVPASALPAALRLPAAPTQTPALTSSHASSKPHTEAPELPEQAACQAPLQRCQPSSQRTSTRAADLVARAVQALKGLLPCGPGSKPAAAQLAGALQTLLRMGQRTIGALRGFLPFIPCAMASSFQKPIRARRPSTRKHRRGLRVCLRSRRMTICFLRKQLTRAQARVTYQSVQLAVRSARIAKQARTLRVGRAAFGRLQGAFSTKAQALREAQEDKARLELALCSASRQLEEVTVERDSLYFDHRKWGHHAATVDIEVIYVPLLENYRRKCAELQHEVDCLSGMQISGSRRPPHDVDPCYFDEVDGELPADWDEAEVFEMDLEEAREIGLVPEHGLKERTVKFHSYFFGILDAYKYRCAKLEEHVFGAPAAQLAPSAQPAPPAQPSAAPSKAVPQQQKQAPRGPPPGFTPEAPHATQSLPSAQEQHPAGPATPPQQRRRPRGPPPGFTPEAQPPARYLPTAQAQDTGSAMTPPQRSEPQLFEDLCNCLDNTGEPAAPAAVHLTRSALSQELKQAQVQVQYGQPMRRSAEVDISDSCGATSFFGSDTPQ